jgi:hypothetical protein
MRPEPVSLKLDRHLAVAFAFALLHCAVYDTSLRVEVSQNDAVYTQQGAASGTGGVQTMTLPASVSARYLGLTVTKAASPQGDFPFAAFFELSVLGI